ncbi:nascent polypeptide-associated complex subunit alpha, muscle-specific form-like isoform X1 [Danaus plexippus]|uniref:nascent polypeptide-associated complex subunit alpha, muscle-specific form-like isoform X1 n=1 Tax=Danaus plexippus TaxID=13037 RepID=UPI002AB31DE8|nr:nascent polypeptide-associated complex subunit alpha, muscle-specific form-like isoform X1 [Danaus plexippus]
MALVLRKAVMPKNVSLLKCIKGRPLATASNKKNAAPLFHNAMKRTLCKRTQSFGVKHFCNQSNIELQKEDVVKSKGRLYRSISCPCLRPNGNDRPVHIKRAASAISLKDIAPRFRIPGVVFNQITPNFMQLRAASTSSAIKDITSVCACPCAPCGCNCLPPPCNTPAKCLQYMTGYYYYPYGTWFCGPYHISTGPCGPCAGPVRPDGCGGPAPPCPGGPCGPACIGPCKPCGPCICGPCGACGPCGPCGPLSCCGFCGIGNSFPNYPPGSPYDFSSFNAYGAYGPYTPQPPPMFPNQPMQPNFCPPFNSFPQPQPQFGPVNLPGNHFGPCYDVPMPSPIPIDALPQNPFMPPPSNAPNPPGPVRPSYNFAKPTLKDSPTTENVRSAPSIDGPCPKNLTPKSLRMSPLSRYENSLKMGSSSRPPRMNGRALQDINTSFVCHFSTGSMQTRAIETDRNRSNIFRAHTKKTCKGSCNKPFCHWCPLKGK